MAQQCCQLDKRAQRVQRLNADLFSQHSCRFSALSALTGSTSDQALMRWPAVQMQCWGMRS